MVVSYIAVVGTYYKKSNGKEIEIKESEYRKKSQKIRKRIEKIEKSLKPANKKKLIKILKKLK